MKSGRMWDRAHGLAWIADLAITAWHHIHVAVRALTVAMHPDKLFRRAACRTARHDMGRRRLGALFLLFEGGVCLISHRGPSLSFSRRREAVVPS